MTGHAAVDLAKIRSMLSDVELVGYRAGGGDRDGCESAGSIPVKVGRTKVGGIKAVIKP
jgi:hypothetical protein